MSFSIQRETSDGTLSTIDLAIEYIDQADITVYVDDILIEPTGGVTPFTWEWVTASRIKITPDVTAGRVAMVRRGTPNAVMYHNFNAGATFKDETMDENFLQLLYLVQEAKEGSGATDFYSDLNMYGYTIRNHGAALLDSDVVTFGQYRNDALGAMANRVLAEAARDTVVAAKDSAVASATNAAISETNANASKVAAGASAAAAEADRILAGTSAANAVAAYDSFDDRYLGSKSSDPSVDNDGDPLMAGALYWNTAVSELRVFDGAWLSVALLPNTYLIIQNNLADLDDAVAAKANLGLGQVDNTSDADKPISTAQASGLVAKTGDTGAAVIPTGTKAQRPASPVNGQLRYNSENSQFEGYQAGEWKPIGGGDSIPLFSVMWWPQRSAIPAGFVAADGQTLGRSTYPDAWAGIRAGNVPTVADAAWNSTPTERGKFTTGDGSTTFRLPDYNGQFAGSLGAVFLRGDGALSAGTAGVIQGDATRNAAGTGAIAVTGCWVIKLFGAVVNVGSADAAQLASDFANIVGKLEETSWITPTLLNSWVPAPGYQPPQYKRVGNRVYVRGAVQGGAAGLIFGLAIGYRPPASLLFSTIYGSGAAAMLACLTGGNLSVGTLSTGALPLEFSFAV